MKDVTIDLVKLYNFRIHEGYKLKLNQKITSILGENGCGKTSVLEAIYIALQGKSFRAVDREILRRESEYYKIEVVFSSGEKIAVSYDGRKKTFLVQDKKCVRLPRKNKYPVVLFLPEDLHLVASSPTSKREYFDRFLIQLDESYSSNLSKYNNFQ